MQTTNRNSYFWPVLALLLTGLFFFVREHLADERRKIIESGTSAVGSLSETTAKWVTCTFTDNNSSYEVVATAPFNYLQDGERYRILFLPSDPEKIVIQFDQPVFFDSTFYGKTRIDQLATQEDRWRFTYTVDERIYTRFQQKTIKDSCSAQSCYVKYFLENPRIAYLVSKNK